MLRNLTITKKLLFVIIPLFLVLIIFVSVSAYQMLKISNGMNKVLYSETYVSTASILNADRDFYQAAIALKELTVAEQLTTTQIEGLKADYIENANQVLERMTIAMDNLKENEALYNDYKHSVTGESLSMLNATFNAAYEAWWTSYDINALSGDIDMNLSQFGIARDAINLMTEILETYAAEKSTETIQSSQQIITLLIIFGLFTITLMTVITFIIMRLLKTSVAEVTQALVSVSNKNLNVSIDEKIGLSKDEFGVLTRSTESVVSMLKNMISTINHSVTQMGDASEVLHTSTSEITSALNEVSEAVNEIADSATKQAHDTVQVTSHINSLGEMIQTNTNNTENLYTMSTTIETLSSEGLKLVNHLSEESQENSKLFESSSEHKLALIKLEMQAKS